METSVTFTWTYTYLSFDQKSRILQLLDWSGFGSQNIQKNYCEKSVAASHLWLLWYEGLFTYINIYLAAKGQGLPFVFKTNNNRTYAMC